MKLSCLIKSNFERSLLADVLGAFSCLFGISYGLAAYTAPNYFFGPNGLTPAFIKTDLESNDLDPITEHYMRCQGISLITLIVSYYLFAFGDLESERMFLKCSFFAHAAVLAISATWLKDEAVQEFSGISTLQATCLFSAVQIVRIGHGLLDLPKTKAHSSEAAMAPSIDSIIFYACALYVGQICASKAYFGADATFFPGTEFNAQMNAEARMFGAWFIPYVYILLFEAQRMPKLTYKIMAFCCMLTLPVKMKVIHEGHCNQKAFSAIFIATATFMVLAFYRLGAFSRDDLGKKKHANSEEIIGALDDGMHLRDGRVISQKAQ